MTILGLLLLVIAIVVVGTLAGWLIHKFCPQEYKVTVGAVVGLILLIVLLSVVVPGVLNQRVW